MATLTNTKIKDTYDGLLKTTDNDVIGITEKVITDGLGNASILSIGTQSASFSNNVVITGSLTASGLSYPTSDGTAGQAIVTDAAGNLSFATVTSPTPTLQQVTTAGATTTDSITVGGLTASSLIYPSTDGTSGQVISTDGAGNLTFTTVSTSTPSLDQVTAVGATSSVDIEVNGLTVGKGNNSRTNNAALGVNALTAVTTGNQNTAIGSYALEDNTIGINNTAVGYRSLYNNISGGLNVAIGNAAMGASTTGSFNIAIGTSALNDGNCQYSVAIGDGALQNNTSNNNTSIGANSLSNINGANNVALGYGTGDLVSGGSNKTLGDNNVYIGASVVSAASDTDNEIVIGANAVGNGSNSATYGDSNITKHIFTSGNVQIQTSGAELYFSDNAQIRCNDDNHRIRFRRSENLLELVEYGSIIMSTGATPSEKMRIDSSGNVGIGTQSADDLMHIEDNDATVSATQLTLEGRYGGYGAGINFVSRTSSGGTRVSMAKITADGESSWNTTASTQDAGLRFFTTDGGSQSERMRIDSSGNVGIGLTPSMKFQVKSSGTSTEDVASFGNANISDGLVVTTNGNLDWGLNARNTRNLTFSTNQSERMRITSGGDVLIGTQGLPDGTTYYGSGFRADSNSRKSLRMASSSSGAQDIIEFYNPNGRVGYIQMNGTATSYVQSGSDLRLKKNIEDWSDSVLNDFATIEPKLFHFNQQQDTEEKIKGYIAQDMIDKFPEAYPQGENGFLGYNPSGMVVYLIKAVKELTEKVATLESQLNA